MKIQFIRHAILLLELTAEVPMLNVLKQQAMENVLIVVVR
jgi:hypothetical protein